MSFMFGHENAKGKREYSSSIVSMYAFRDVVGSGPLRSNRIQVESSWFQESVHIDCLVKLNELL